MSPPHEKVPSRCPARYREHLGCRYPRTVLNGEPRTTSCIFVTQKRGANELVPFIRKWVEPGSILISDEWRGYTQELAQHYYRATVNHSVEFGYTAFVDGVEISINTNHIEREWREVRKAVEFLPASRFQEKLNREVFLLLFFAGHLKEELPFIFLENMAASMNY